MGTYAPMSARHKWIFGVAAAVFVSLMFLVATGRIQLIQWWLVHCDHPSRNCQVATAVIDYWWVAFVPLALALGWLAHRLTRDRLVSPAQPLE